MTTRLPKIGTSVAARAKAKLSHEDFSQARTQAVPQRPLRRACCQAHHTLRDRRGDQVKFDDQPEVQRRCRVRKAMAITGDR